jgi:hypothetical protein
MKETDQLIIQNVMDEVPGKLGKMVEIKPFATFK